MCALRKCACTKSNNSSFYLICVFSNIKMKFTIYMILGIIQLTAGFLLFPLGGACLSAAKGTAFVIATNLGLFTLLAGMFSLLSYRYRVRGLFITSLILGLTAALLDFALLISISSDFGSGKHRKKGRDSYSVCGGYFLFVSLIQMAFNMVQAYYTWNFICCSCCAERMDTKETSLPPSPSTLTPSSPPPPPPQQAQEVTESA